MMAQAKQGFQQYSVEELAEAYRKAGVPPGLTPEESRLLIRLWCRLARGTDIAHLEVEQAAVQVGMDPEAAYKLIGWMAELDEAGNVKGLLGLTLNDGFPTKLSVGGHELRTWCAWDSLFLPIMLGGEAIVEAPSAVSGAPVRVTVGPDGVKDVSPAGAHVSFVVPSNELAGLESIQDIWMVFCEHLLYFGSRAEAEQWAQGKDGLATTVHSVEDAFRLAKTLFAALAQYTYGGR